MAKQKKSFLQFNFTDFVALAILVSCFVLMAIGRNSFVHYVLASIVGFYFGSGRRQ